MKKFIIILVSLLFSPIFSFASTTNGTILTPYAWGENVGWVNFTPTNGNVHITDSIITGYAWDSVYGWINLSPDNSGVKNDGQGNLSGSAWSQNAGWIDFTGVKLDSIGKFTGVASGSVYGKLSFDCTNCSVTTDWRKSSNIGGPSSLVSSPTAGIYNSTQFVTLNASGSNSIRYSTSSTPTDCSSGTLYSSSISVSTSTTIYVRACDASNHSTITSFDYIIDTTPPVIPISVPVSGTYTQNQLVQLSSVGSDYIQYSTISIPTSCTNGTSYSSLSPIFVSTSETIYVRACDLAGNSSTKSFSYVISTNRISGSYLPGYWQQITQPVVSNILFSKNLKQGVTNPEVKELQKYLNDKGYIIAKSGPGSKGNETNNFGPATRIALIKFQKANKLTPDGLMGTKTRDYINKYKVSISIPTTSTKLNIAANLKQGMISNDVKLLQVYLNTHGYIITKIGLGSPGNETTYFGLKTKKAVIVFQKANQLITDGIVGPKMREVMK